MKKHWIEYQVTRPDCPMTFWVHRAVDGEAWFSAEAFEPPRQPAVPGRGYPVFKVEIDGFTFEFASLAEIDACVEVLSKKLLPRTIDLSEQRGTGKGPNSHWLSRLPGRVKPWRYRQKAVEYLRKASVQFRREFA